MPENNLNRFFLSIVVPSMLAIGFFIILIFTVILPVFERNIMDGKKETISELTNTAWSLVDEYYREVLKGKMEDDSARNLAASRIEQIRYGDEYKDYFWIIDKQPLMVMHPYRTELIASDLSNYKDPNGKLLFVEATKVVEKDGEGFINYMWQWKDDSIRIVPKLSFVKEFKAWDWIIGTGIYLEDVRAEINTLKNKLLRITLIFTLLICTLLTFIIRQSLLIERKRKSAEQKLRVSRQKYKALVEASTEGTLMILKDEIIFSNIKFSRLSGYDPIDVRSLNIKALFGLDWDNLLKMFRDPKRSVSHETDLQCSDGSIKEVIISVSKITFENESGFIIIVKELSAGEKLEKEAVLLSADLQDTLLLMDQPIKSFTEEGIWCSQEMSINDAASLMSRNNRDLLFVSNDDKLPGIVRKEDMSPGIYADGWDSSIPISKIVTKKFETISENTPVYQAILAIESKKVSFLLTLGSDRIPKGYFGKEQIIEVLKNSFNFLHKEIRLAENVEQLKKIYKRLPILVKALLESGSKTTNINRIITGVADAIHLQVIRFAIKEYGPPPCEFAFIVLGSEGRGEQTLATDQDNAIIFKDRQDDNIKDTEKYFLGIGEIISRALDDIGYKYCKGKIMANNPKWTQPLDVWKDYFSRWINTGNPEDILEAEIFFDFRLVYGDTSLVTDLQSHVEATASNKSVFFYNMAESVLKFKAPLNIFGSIIGKESDTSEFTLNIKKVMLPVLTFVRLYSIREKLSETNSLERLKKLAELKIIDDSSYEDLLFAYDTMMRIRLRKQVDAIWENENPTNDVDIKKLTRIELLNLKKSLTQIANLQTKISFDFKAGN